MLRASRRTNSKGTRSAAAIQSKSSELRRHCLGLLSDGGDGRHALDVLHVLTVLGLHVHPWVPSRNVPVPPRGATAELAGQHSGRGAWRVLLARSSPPHAPLALRLCSLEYRETSTRAHPALPSLQSLNVLAGVQTRYLAPRAR